MRSMVVQVGDPGLKAEYLNLLSQEEREFVLSVSHPAVARERLLARVLVRTTLARCGPRKKSVQM